MAHQIKVERPQTCTATTLHKNKAKFDGSTTYGIQFSPKLLDRREQIKPQYKKNTVPFSGQTIYNSEFQPYKV